MLSAIISVFLNLIIYDWCSLSNLNTTDYNEFTGSLPAEIWFLTGLSALSLGKWKYVIDNLDCLRISYFANCILSAFESHYK